MVISRLFTIAARDQHEKVTPQTAELLKDIGAKPPKAYGSALACYGVLYQRNNPHCVKCGLRPSCATEAANYGLTKIALSPRLLGVKNIRIPAILPEAPSPSASNGSADTSEPNTGSEMEVVAHLAHHFTRVNRGGDVFFTLKNDAVPLERARSTAMLTIEATASARLGSFPGPGRASTLGSTKKGQALLRRRLSVMGIGFGFFPSAARSSRRPIQARQSLSNR
jgi:adenine-specific DNA glycosylase